MSEFSNLEGDAEKYAKDHPQQVQEGEKDAEHAVESKIDPNGGQDQNDQGQGGQQGNSGQDASQQSQGQ